MAPLSISLGNFIGSSVLYGGSTLDNRFVIRVKTDNIGTSNDNQFTITTDNTGITQAFSYTVRTSDGQTLTGLTGDTTITFPSAGEYDIRISGVFPYMRFGGAGDRRKLLEIKNFGIYGLGSTSQNGAFWGCTNLVITAEDIGHFEDVTNFQLSWNNCKSLTSFPLIDTSSATTFQGAWTDCTLLTSFPEINTQNGINFGFSWKGCTSLTSFPLIKTDNALVFSETWELCTSLSDFPANSFDSSNASNYADAFKDTNLTTQSIDDILVSLDNSGILNGTFLQSGGQAASATGEAAKVNLVNNGWVVTLTA